LFAHGGGFLPDVPGFVDKRILLNGKMWVSFAKKGEATTFAGGHFCARSKNNVS